MRKNLISPCKWTFLTVIYNKRNHSRRRTGTMSASDFFTWSEDARAKLKECEAGQMALDEYKMWLGNTK
jgi:hypothetical protein